MSCPICGTKFTEENRQELTLGLIKTILSYMTPIEQYGLLVNMLETVEVPKIK